MTHTASVALSTLASSEKLISYLRDVPLHSSAMLQSDREDNGAPKQL